jgi:succinate dehydrogenase / fumarate reductase, cytochrome b subunit
MALSGLVLVLFVMGHMLGNLQIFLGADVINAYAYKLHHVLPTSALWGIRAVLLGCVGVHIWMAVWLTLDNRKARPSGYEEKKVVQATYSSRTMRMSGAILLAFIFFHIAHYTARIVPGLDYNAQIADVALIKNHEQVIKNGEVVMTFNVNDMMIDGFHHVGVSIFYIIATGLLCMHLTHGVSSMFQSVGLRNKVWRPRLDRAALVYGWVVFLGFAVIPVASLSGILKKTADAPAIEAVEAAIEPLHR